MQLLQRVSELLEKFIIKKKEDFIKEKIIKKISKIVKISDLYPIVIGCLKQETADRIIESGLSDIEIIKASFENAIINLAHEGKDYRDLFYEYESLYFNILVSSTENNTLFFLPTIITKDLFNRLEKEFNLRTSERNENLFMTKWSKIKAFEHFVKIGKKSGKELKFFYTR